MTILLSNNLAYVCYINIFFLLISSVTRHFACIFVALIETKRMKS